MQVVDESIFYASGGDKWRLKLIRFHTMRDWMKKELNVQKCLQISCVWYVISFTLISRKHSLKFASEISGKDKSLFSRLLKNNSDVAVFTLKDLSKRTAKRFSKALKALKSLPWKVALIVDQTGQGRSSLHSQNVQRLNHGQGFFVGHQWTNIVLLVGDLIIPLLPIPFYTRKYCKENKLEYKSEHVRVAEYLQAMDLGEYIEGYHPEEVVVLADSGYDDKKIQKTILDKGWDFVMALKKKRSVKSITEQLKTKPSQGWSQVQVFFKAHRRLAWETVRLFTSGTKKRRKEFRIRHTMAWLKAVGQIQVVCSERKNAPGGERKYFACSHLTISPGQILIAYSLRWKVELFHKAIKMHLGFEDVSTVSFDSVVSHVHWVYCAYILLMVELPGVPSSARTIAERQRYVMSVLEHKEKANLLQRLTRINGPKQLKNELKEALAA